MTYIYIKPIEFEVNRPDDMPERLSGGGTHRNDPAFPDWDIVDMAYSDRQTRATCIEVSLRWQQTQRIAQMRYWCDAPRSVPSAEATSLFWSHFPRERFAELLDLTYKLGVAEGRAALCSDFAKLMGIDRY